MNKFFSPWRHGGTEKSVFERQDQQNLQESKHINTLNLVNPVDPVRKNLASVPPCLRGEFFIFLCLFAACQKTPRNTTPAFYHWKTQFALTVAETAYLDALDCRKIYVKFLDIGKDPLSGEISPYSLLEVKDTTGLAGKNIVPCVFITNSVFQHISTEKLDWLAVKTAGALTDIGRQFPRAAFAEIQFDCDWTPATRMAFFYFLKKIRNALSEGTTISATIRLHQYKFPGQTGVPPADRGMLMLYNTGDIDDWAEENSIFQPQAAQKYLQGGAPARYPLPLDLALPAFSWALVYRDDELWKIIPDPDFAEFRDTGRFETIGKAERQSNNRISIRRNTFLAGHYLRTGDLVRVERIDTALLREAARLAAGIELAPGASVAFYHLDTATVRQYPAKWLKTVWETINSTR